MRTRLRRLRYHTYPAAPRRSSAQTPTHAAVSENRTGAIARRMEREGNEESRAPMKVRGCRLQGVSQADYSAVDRERKGFTKAGLNQQISTKKSVIYNNF